MRYSEEIKEIARKMLSDGLSQIEVARRLGVSRRAIGYWGNGSQSQRRNARERERQHQLWQDPNHRKQKNRYECERQHQLRQDPEYRRQDNKQKNKCKRKQRALREHPSVTYVIGSPDYPDRVIIGTTINLCARLSGYKSFAPLQLLGLSPLPERAVHRYFQRERIGKAEFFKLSPELQEFIDKDCCEGDDECFTGEAT